MRNLLLNLCRWALAAFCLLSCTKFDIDDEQWPIAPDSSPSEYSFQQFYVGRGWRSEITYTIKNGRVTKENYYSSRVGANSSDYYFGENELTSFFTSDAYPDGPFYHTQSYEYKEEDCSIYADGHKVMTIVDMNKKRDSFEAIEQLGVKSDGTKVFGLTKYRLMTDEELAKTRESHKKNWNTKGSYADLP